MTMKRRRRKRKRKMRRKTKKRKRRRRRKTPHHAAAKEQKPLLLLLVTRSAEIFPRYLKMSDYANGPQDAARREWETAAAHIIKSKHLTALL